MKIFSIIITFLSSFFCFNCHKTNYYIYPQRDIKVPTGKDLVYFNGTLEKCSPPEGRKPYAWECGRCFNYHLIMDDNDDKIFNDQDYQLDKIINKKITLIGYENLTFPLSCPKSLVATKIYIQDQ